MAFARGPGLSPCVLIDVRYTLLVPAPFEVNCVPPSSAGGTVAPPADDGVSVVAALHSLSKSPICRLDRARIQQQQSVLVGRADSTAREYLSHPRCCWIAQPFFWLDLVKLASVGALSYHTPSVKVCLKRTPAHREAD